MKETIIVTYSLVFQILMFKGDYLALPNELGGFLQLQLPEC